MRAFHPADQSVERIYRAVLERAAAQPAAFHDELRRRGIAATPDDEPGHLYALNPVVVPRRVVRAMIEDLRLFCAERRRMVVDAETLLADVPALVREHFASTDLAGRLIDDLGRRHPFACLDAYLVDTDHGIDRAYLEWQTFPAYPALGLEVLGCLRRAFPEIEAEGGSLTAEEGLSLETLREELIRLYTGGLEDPREVLILDFEPMTQVTRREFLFAQALTGGPEKGLGIADPRELRRRGSGFVYRRDGRELPVRRVFSRLVDSDIERGLWPALGGEEKEVVTRFFQESETIDWVVHPLHFHYGSKADFPAFQAAGLSEALPPCFQITTEFLEQARLAGPAGLRGWVQKPTRGCGGDGVLPDPLPHQLVRGAILQKRIEPADCHLTTFGPRMPEVRVMGLPKADGSLWAPILFSRVKGRDAFRSNAGATAALGVPGTGEGYAVVAP